jgi:hypothetical protein
MRLHLRGELAKLMALTTTWAMFIAPTVASAQDHVVPLAEVERAVRSKAETRAQSIADIDRVMSLPVATKELQRVNVSQSQIHAAVSTLSDEELARLAQQARSSEQEVQGGFIVGILALIGLIVVIVIVLAVVAH